MKEAGRDIVLSCPGLLVFPAVVDPPFASGPAGTSARPEVVAESRGITRSSSSPAWLPYTPPCIFRSGCSSSSLLASPPINPIARHSPRRLGDPLLCNKLVVVRADILVPTLASFPSFLLRLAALQFPPCPCSSLPSLSKSQWPATTVELRYFFRDLLRDSDTQCTIQD